MVRTLLDFCIWTLQKELPQLHLQSITVQQFQAHGSKHRQTIQLANALGETCTYGHVWLILEVRK
jgi:hypothetical protein